MTRNKQLLAYLTIKIWLSKMMGLSYDPVLDCKLFTGNLMSWHMDNTEILLSLKFSL